MNVKISSVKIIRLEIEIPHLFKEKKKGIIEKYVINTEEAETNRTRRKGKSKVQNEIAKIFQTGC